jgi:hypothetical protein
MKALHLLDMSPTLLKGSSECVFIESQDLLYVLSSGPAGEGS